MKVSSDLQPMRASAVAAWRHTQTQPYVERPKPKHTLRKRKLRSHEKCIADHRFVVDEVTVAMKFLECRLGFVE